MNSDIPFIDLHTHQAIISDKSVWQVANVMAGETPPAGARYLSLGIHPWQLLHEKDIRLEYALIKQHRKKNDGQHDQINKTFGNYRTKQSVEGNFLLA